MTNPVTDSRTTTDGSRPRSQGWTDALPGTLRTIQILIVDGHPIFRDGLRTVITSQSDMAVVGQASTFGEALAEFRLHTPDITLWNHSLADAADLDRVAGIRSEFPRARVILLTTPDTDLTVQRALRSGAAGFLFTSAPQSELLRSIRLVHDGHKYISPDIAKRIAEYLSNNGLSPREIDVLKLIRDGHRSKEIAYRLSIAETTVTFHIRNLVDKLGASGRAHAVAIGISRGLLEF
jgi:DNA-binding NarL/FixJ family response regulator